ncbi:MAG: HAMP domain-containing protein [Burkholderiales bacterium]|nr:HAMP domain-containing protein [Burkholderiales bacterium]
MPTIWRERWRFPLYLRIWLAVIAAVGVLTIAFGWLWQVNREQTNPPREVVIRNEADEVIGQSMVRPMRVPGAGIEFDVKMHDGSTITVQLPPRQRRPGEGPPGRSFFPRGPTGFIWLLGIVAMAVIVGSYPIIRRLTMRLEELRGGVERWGEGDLSVRVAENGNDEVAFLARRFNHAAERVETLVKTHKSLLANASHELRSPLARIRMGLELMTPEPSPAARAEISRNIAELDQLIDEILLASRLDAREPDMGTVEAVDLTGLAAEECARTGATLEAVTAGQSVVVPGVSRLLRRAVRNLLENARRYSPDEVTVAVQQDAGHAVLRVCDRGPGIPPAEREHIFEPFYRLPGASERHGGVGLGLSLVRSIAQRHQGSVHCEDREGGGACFVLRLPAQHV